MFGKIMFIFCALAATEAFGQGTSPPVPSPPPAPPAPPSQSVSPPEVLEHWRRSTVAIGLPIDGKFITNGTGLLVTANGHFACILTAKHVFFDPTKGWIPTSISFRLPKDTANQEEDIGISIVLNDSGKTYWSASDDADLAIIRVPDLSKYWNVHAVYVKEFGNSSDVFQGATVVTLGYPMIPGPEYLISPIARAGIIAWVDPIELDKRPFLIDSNIVHGNSGGPVFRIRNGLDKHGNLNLGGGVAFIGVVSKNVTEEAPVHVGTEPALRINQATGKVEQYQASVENIGAIGIIEPASKAIELVAKYCSN